MSGAGVVAVLATQVARGGILYLSAGPALAFARAVLQAAEQLWTQSPALAVMLVAMNLALFAFLADRVFAVTGALTRRIDQ